jgi:glycerate kinase
MKILIAPDSFKDSLSAKKVARSLAKGIQITFPKSVIKILPLADGGEGTLESIENSGTYKTLIASDPLFRKKPSIYLWNDNSKTAYIEMAQTAGLELLEISERNPLKTTSLGTGEQILDAIKNGAKKVVLFVGGSSTNDGGIGMASALGYRFFDKNGNTLTPIGENLIAIADYQQIDTYDLKNIEFIIATDVTNPFSGKNGAAYIYAKQKGASETEIEELDNGLENLNMIFKNKFNIDLMKINGSGAAGGLAGGAFVFLNAKVISAADFIFELCDFHQKIAETDIIISGEGRIDHQTWNGKLIAQLLKYSKEKKVILIGGTIETTIKNEPYIIMTDQIKTKEMTLNFAKKHVEKLLFEKGKEIGEFLKTY